MTRVALLLSTAGIASSCGGGTSVPGLDAGQEKGGQPGNQPPVEKAPMSKPVEFAVPPSGGAVQVPSASGESGMATSFDFPAAAAGKSITLTPVAATAIGWPADQFAEVIRMEPDGAKFEEPIVIRPASGDVIVLDFPSASSQSKPEGLPVNSDGDGFLLSHFSTLVVVPAQKSCGDGSGWAVADTAAAGEHCQDKDFPTYITFSCSAHQYCVDIDASCCAKSGATSCHLGDKQLKVSFAAVPYDARYPYCGGSDSAAKDAGTMDSGAAGQGGSPATSTCNQGADCKCADGQWGRLTCEPSSGAEGVCSCVNSSAAGQGGGNGGSAGSAAQCQLGADCTCSAGVWGHRTCPEGSGVEGVCACVDAGSNGQSGNGGSTTCEPSSQQDCMCSENVWGRRICNQSGAYGACSCSGDAGIVVDPGTPDASVGYGDGGVRTGNDAGDPGPQTDASVDWYPDSGAGTGGYGGGDPGSLPDGGPVRADGGTGWFPDSGTGWFPDSGTGWFPDGGFGGYAGGGGPVGSDAGAADGGMSDSCDTIGSWQSTGVVDNVEYFNAAWGDPASDNNLWAVGKSTAEASGIISHWSGSSWSSEAVGSNGSVLNGVWGSSLGDVFAVGSGGAIYHNDGSSWASFISPTSEDLYGIWGTESLQFWVVGAHGAAFYWDGADWHNYSIVGSASNNIGTLRSVWSATGETVWVVNETGASSNSDYVLQRFVGGTWTAFSNWSYYSQAVWGASSDDVWAVGYAKGTSAHFDGSAWQSSSAPSGGPYLRSVWGRYGSRVWAVGDAGQIDYWDGMHWTACTPVTQLGLNSVVGTASTVWAFGAAGTVLRNVDL